MAGFPACNVSGLSSMQMENSTNFFASESLERLSLDISDYIGNVLFEKSGLKTSYFLCPSFFSHSMDCWIFWHQIPRCSCIFCMPVGKWRVLPIVGVFFWGGGWCPVAQNISSLSAGAANLIMSRTALWPMGNTSGPYLFSYLLIPMYRSLPF